MPELIATLIDALTRPGLTAQFLWLTLALFALSLRRLYRRGPADPWVQSAPNLLLSLGVLGTFAGIVVGLDAFEPAAVDASIGHLLGGLSTAFYTSVMSMALALLYRAAIARQAARLVAAEQPVDDDPVERLIHQHGQAVNQLRQLNVMAREQAEYLIHITNAVADSDDPQGVVAQLAQRREQSEQGVMAVIAALDEIKDQQRAMMRAEQARAEALVGALARQNGAQSRLLERWHEQQLQRAQSAAAGEREWRQRFDTVLQLIKAQPDRRDFHALALALAGRAPVPRRPAAPARSAPAAPRAAGRD